jgi:hypothetical protein
MDKDFIKYFEVSSYLEPPIFMLDLNKLQQVEEIKAVETTQKQVLNTAKEEFLGQNVELTPNTVVNIPMNGKSEPLQLDLSK